MRIRASAKHAEARINTIRTGKAAMAIPHAREGQPVDVRPMGDRLRQEKAVALFKSEDLEVMRLIVLAGKSIPPHAVPGEITIQCIEGQVAITAQEGRSIALEAGQILFLGGGVVHGVEAARDSQILVTISLRKTA